MKASPGTYVPSEERCCAMTLRGPRCGSRRVNGKLCRMHERVGALTPNEWTPSNLPVFYIAKS